MQKSGYLERRALKKTKQHKVKAKSAQSAGSSLWRGLDDYERSMPTRSFKGTYVA